MSFVKPLILATVVVGGATTALWFSRRAEPLAEAPSQEKSEETNPLAPAEAAPVPLPEGPGIDHPARALIPADAWLVVDFRGDLTGESPFAGSEGYCADVPAPERIAVALIPGPQEPELLLVAPLVSDVFWGCARDRIVRSGGNAIAQNDQFEVLQSSSGVAARGPGGSMAFLAGGESSLEKVLAALSGVGESAAHAGVHAGLFRRMHDLPQDEGASARNLPTGASRSDLDMTLALPPGWLTSAGQDAEVSPLRHVRAGFLTLLPDRSARGGIDCVEPGCEDVARFVQRALRDLLSRLPEDQARALREGIHIEHLPSSGRIAVRFDPGEVSLGALFARLFGSSPLGF